MKMSRKKGMIIGGSVIAAVAVIGAGGWAVLKHNQKAVKVAPVANMNQGGWYSSSEIVNYGTVTTNFNQDIYYDETLTITKVYVNPGDEVKIGDPLIAYDTTLATLELEMKQMQIEGIALNIQNVQAELNQLWSTPPVASADQSADHRITVSAADTGNVESAGGNSVQMTAEKDGGSSRFVRLTADIGGEGAEQSGQPENPDQPGRPEYSGNPDQPEDPKDPENPDQPEDPEDPESPDQPGRPEDPEKPTYPSIGTEFPEELRGKTIYQTLSKDAEPYNEDADGSEEHPAHFLCAPGVRADASFMKAVLENQVICVFEVVDDAENPAWILYSWILDGRTGEIIPPEKPEEPENPEEPEEPVVPEEPLIPDILVPSGPTAEELKEEIQEKEQKLKTLELDRREAELELKKLQKKVDNGVIASTVNGMVKTVLDEETARMEGTPMISVTGEQGFYVTGSVAETALDKIKEGMTATVMSWETGMTYEASVTGVGGSPVSGYYYGNNENMSYYPFTVVIKGDAELTNGQGVDLSVDGLSNSASDELYLSRMFVREEGNLYYVYKKGENGRLTKQYVEVGKSIYDTLEILSGLSGDDEIAFPYGKDVKEGAKTESADTLYEYY